MAASGKGVAIFVHGYYRGGEGGISLLDHSTYDLQLDNRNPCWHSPSQ